MAKLSDLKGIGQFVKVFVYGNAGCGKTCFSTGFPGPIWLADFDGKVSSAARYWEKKNPAKLDEIEYENFQPTSINGGFHAFAKFEAKLRSFEESIKNGAFDKKTIVIDSLTTLSEALLQYTVATQNGIKRMIPGQPALQDYGVMTGAFRPLIYRILALPCNIVMVGHVVQDKDESTGAITYRPALSGKLPELIPILFEEVYRSFTEEKDGKIYYLAQSRPYGGFTARSQIPNLPNKFKLSYETIKIALDGKGEAK